MPLIGGKGKNRFNVEPPKIRIEKVVIEQPAPHVASEHHRPALHARSVSSSASSRRVSKLTKRAAAAAAAAATVPATASTSPNNPEAGRARKRKKTAAAAAAAAAAATPSRRSPATDRIAFDKDSDEDETNNDVDDDAWMRLDSTRGKRPRQDDEGDAAVDAAGARRADDERSLCCARAFEGRVDGLLFTDAVEVASLDANCLPVMGAQKEDVAIEVQYPTLQRREKFELVWGKGKIDPVQAVIRIVQHVANTYLTEDEAEPLMNRRNGVIRRMERASNRNIQDLAGFKSALDEYNETLLNMVEDGMVERNVEALREVPSGLVAFILDQVYDRTVAPRIELLSKYENGSDFVYGELLHPFISRILVEQTGMTSDQVFVDLGSGVGNVCLHAALAIGCESWGCEMQEGACMLAQAQAREFSARATLWGLNPGVVHLEQGDFRTSTTIHAALKRADVVLVNNKAFSAQLNDDLVRMFLDLKPGCRVVSLRSFVADSKSGHSINDVGSTILDVEEFAYPEGFVSWTHAGGEYYISTRK